MPIPAIIVTAISWLGRIGLAVFAVNEIQTFLNNRKEQIETANAAAEQAGVTETDYKKLVAATTYDTVEKNGGEPEDFWAGLTPAEKEALQFSPSSLQSDIGRTKFLGLSSALLFVSALFASGIAAKRGIPILLSTLVKIRDARARGATALELMTIVEEGKIAGIAKVWVPTFLAGIAGAGGWLTTGMTNNLNDATLWGRIFLGQAADDFVKAQQQTARGSSGAGATGNAPQAPRTIIRIVEEKKPEQFIGTLFSAKLGSADRFERKVDDEITDMDDLRDDVKINLNRWLTSLPNRMGYSVVVRKDPVDEFGTKQSGVWATLTLFITHISGKITPIDTILLGPVTPQTRLELQKQSKSIENEIQGFVSAATVNEIQVPGGTVDIFTPDGQKTTLSDVVADVPKEASASNVASRTPTDTGRTPTPRKEESKPVKVVTESEAKKEDERQRQFEENVANIPQNLREGPAAVGFNDKPLGAPLKGVVLLRNQTILTDTPGSVLNVRKRPGLSAEILTKLPDGTLIGAAGNVRQADGLDWLPVFVMIDGRERGAYVALDFVKAT